MTYKLDNKDHEIIRLLRKNSRTSVRELGKETGYRPSTIHQRIQRLIRNKVIDRFTLKLDPKAVGENFVVFMFIATEAKIEDSAFARDCIREVYGITGEYDLLVKMKFSGVEEFNDFVLEFRERYNLKKTVTMVATVRIKEEL